MVTSFLNRFAPINFDGYIDRLTDRFTGREWLFEQHFDPWLQQQGKEQFYLLTGEPGVGKSAIVAQLVKRWKVQPEDAEQGILAAYHFCRAGDVETVRPGRVLRSIAAQLGETLPHYGKALNKVLEQVHLNIDVNININSLTNSQVTGIYIENLKDLDPREELRLLIQAPLSELPAIYKALPEKDREKLPTLKVFLIDSLDEAVTTTGRDNVATLLAALSQANDLPPWIRFILTARPGILKVHPGSDTVLQFQSLKDYELEKLLAENLTDIERYVTRRVRDTLDQPETKFQARLEQAQLSAEALVQEVRDLSKGNFLYTRLVMDGIGTGELSLKNLSALPKNLYEVYQRFLRHRCSVRKWINLYQPLLGTLTVTQEAISSAQLAKFAKVASDQVEGVPQVESAIAILQQFLDEVENDEGQKLYTIFHQSLREYLLDQKHNHDFWCDAKEQHENIIEYCKEESKDWEDLRAIDLYGLRHLAQHLVKGDRVEDLHKLLNREKDGRNAWFGAKDRVAETAGFLADVELAWMQADKICELEPGKSIGLQCRYALIRTSINSSARIPTSLMVALLEQKYWSPAKALAYIRQIPDLEHKAQTLTVLACQLPDSEPIKKQVLQLALQAIDSIFQANALGIKSPPTTHADFFAKLIDELPYDLLSAALDIAMTIATGGLCEYVPRAHVLIALANKLPEAFPKALDTVLAIHDERDRARILAEMTDRFPQVLPQAVGAALEIENVGFRVEALTRLSNKLPELASKALDAALAVQDDPWDYTRAKALVELAHRLPEAIPKALQATQALESESARAETLTALAEKLPEVLPQALEAALAIQDDASRAHGLIDLVDKLPEILSKALDVVLAIDNQFYRVKALTRLADKLTPKLLPKALEAALSFKNEYYRTEALAALASNLPKLLPQALETILMIEDEDDRINALSELAPKLAPDLLPRALEIAQTAQDTYAYTSVLTRLSDEINASSELAPELLLKALDTALTIKTETLRCIALKELAIKLPPNLLSIVLKAAQEFEDVSDRTSVLIKLAERLPEALPQALNAALLIQNSSIRFDYLNDLADKLPESVPHALNAALSIQHPRFRVKSLIQLAGKLTLELLPKVLQTAQAYDNYYYRASILVALSDKFPELLSEALEATLAIQEKIPRAETLAELAIKLPDILPQALDAILELEEPDRVPMLVVLANNLPANLLSQVLDAGLAIQNVRDRAKILTAFAEKFPEVLPQAQNAALSIQDVQDRAWALIALVDKSPELLPNALNAALTFDEESGATDPALRLQGLAAKLSPDLLPRALEATQKIENWADRGSILGHLAPRFDKTFEHFNLWTNLLHFSSQRTRSSLLSDLEALIPALSTLGGRTALVGTVQAVQDVSRWWP